MTPAEALSVVREIYFGPAENAVVTPLLEKLQRAFPHARFSDLRYHNPVELAPEQVVDEAMRHAANYAK